MQALPKQCTMPRYDYGSTGVLLPSTMLLFRSLEISLKKNYLSLQAQLNGIVQYPDARCSTISVSLGMLSSFVF